MVSMHRDLWGFTLSTNRCADGPYAGEAGDGKYIIVIWGLARKPSPQPFQERREEEHSKYERPRGAIPPLIAFFLHSA
jgi:hypothetical protein